MIVPTQIFSLAAASLLTLGATFGGSSVTDLSSLSGSGPRADTTFAADADYSAEVTAKVNTHRAENGHAPVVQSARLDAEAQKWADYLATTGQFKHEDMYCDGMLCMSENIAITRPDSPLNAFQQWVNSPGHNANLLRSNAVQVGHGVAIMQSGIYRGQPIVVQKFFNQF